MSIILNNVNSLPVKTWRRLGVNGETLDIELPEPQVFEYVKPRLPEGVVNTHESVLLCAEFKSAAASELAASTRVHSNAGVAIRCKMGAKAREPIAVRYEFGPSKPVLVDNNVIFAEPHSEVTVVMIYDGGGDQECFHSGLTRVIAENCAVVRVVQVQTLGKKTEHFSVFSAVIANGASVELTRLELGAKNVYGGCHMKLEGDKAEARTDTFYFGDGDRKLDFNYIARHHGKATNSVMEACGALFDSCGKIFRGTIDFLNGASDSRGAENESTLMFSENARNRSAPLILCGEESVEGSHAASIGRMDAGKLYYLRSRGLSEADARRLMVMAQTETVMKNLPDGQERERLREWLGGRIS
ncbi:MAG: SufD family Fe-S cluster assembly protein [Clostridiales bacterium]|nr:SufD family Fe-S cluster assembly protein [Clostridiales bacterium]